MGLAFLNMNGRWIDVLYFISTLHTLPSFLKKPQHVSNIHGESKIIIFSSKVKARDRCNENIETKFYVNMTVILCGQNKEKENTTLVFIC